MGLVLVQSLMVISSTGVLLYAKVSHLFNVLCKWLCCCLQVNYIVYKHFDRSLYIGSLDPQNFSLYLVQFLRYWNSKEQEQELEK